MKESKIKKDKNKFAMYVWLLRKILREYRKLMMVSSGY